MDAPIRHAKKKKKVDTEMELVRDWIVSYIVCLEDAGSSYQDVRTALTLNEFPVCRSFLRMEPGRTRRGDKKARL